MTKNKKIIAAFLGLNLFLTMPAISLAKKNTQFKNLFETTIGNNQKNKYNFRLYCNTIDLNEYNTDLLDKLFTCYLVLKVPGMKDDTIKSSFFLDQFTEKSNNDRSLFLNDEELKKINKYYTKEKVKNLIEGNIENYAQLINKVVSIYDKNINEIKKYAEFLKDIKTDESYLEILEQIENRNREKIDLLKNNEEELTEKEKLEKAKEAVRDEVKVAEILVDRYNEEKEEIKNISIETFKKFLKGFQLDDFLKDKKAKIFWEKSDYDNYSNLKIKISLEEINGKEIYDDFLPSFFAKCLYDTLKNDTKNKAAQNFIKKNKEKLKKKDKDKIYYINQNEIIKKYPIGLRYAHKDHKNRKNLIFSFESIKNIKEAKMIVDYMNSKKFKENLKKNLKEENFEKYKNEVIEFIEKNRKYKNYKKQKNKTNTLEKEIENIIKRKKERIKDNEERLKKEKNPIHIKSKKRSIKKDKEYLKDKKQIKEDALYALENKKHSKDKTYNRAEKWINKFKKISAKNLKKICDTYEITKAKIERY